MYTHPHTPTLVHPSPLQARVEELTEEAASQAGQRQAAERITDALRAELLAARAAAATSAQQQAAAADEAAASRQQLAAQVAQLEADKADLLGALRACQQELLARPIAAAAAAAVAPAASPAFDGAGGGVGGAAERREVVVISARSSQDAGGGGEGRAVLLSASASAAPQQQQHATSVTQRLQQLKAGGPGRGHARTTPAWMDPQMQGPPATADTAGAGDQQQQDRLSARSAATVASSASGASWLPLRPPAQEQQQQHHHQQHQPPALPPRPPVSATLAEQQQPRRPSAASAAAAPQLGHGPHSTPEVRDANHRRVWAALSTVLLAGPALADRLRGARTALESAPDRQVVILVASSGGRGRSGGGAYHGLYAVVEEPAERQQQQQPGGGAQRDAASVLAVRIHGTGPPVLTTAMVTSLFKFDTAARELREVGSSHTFTFTTDAVGVDAAHLGGGR